MADQFSNPSIKKIPASSGLTFFIGFEQDPETNTLSELKYQESTDFKASLQLGTAANLNVAVSGNAGANEVVKGNDTRLNFSGEVSTNVNGTTVVNPIFYTNKNQTAIQNSDIIMFSDSSDNGNFKVITVGDLLANGITNVNLSYSAGATNGVITCDAGDNATIPLATSTEAGLFSPAEKTKLGDDFATEVESAYNSQVDQISVSEIADPTGTDVRRFSPDDVRQIAAAFGAGGGEESALIVVENETERGTHVPDSSKMIFQRDNNTFYKERLEGNFLDIQDQPDSFAAGDAFRFINDKTEIIKLEDGTVFKIPLSTAGDLDSAGLATQSLNLNSLAGSSININSQTNMSLLTDLTKLYVSDEITIYQYDFGVPGDISTLSYVGSFSSGGSGGYPFSGFNTALYKVNNEGTAMIEASDYNGSFNLYSLINGDLSSNVLLSSVSLYGISFSFAASIAFFNSDLSQFLIYDGYDQTVDRITFDISGDVSSTFTTESDLITLNNNIPSPYVSNFTYDYDNLTMTVSAGYGDTFASYANLISTWVPVDVSNITLGTGEGQVPTVQSDGYLPPSVIPPKDNLRIAQDDSDPEYTTVTENKVLFKKDENKFLIPNSDATAWEEFLIDNDTNSIVFAENESDIMWQSSYIDKILYRRDTQKLYGNNSSVLSIRDVRDSEMITSEYRSIDFYNGGFNGVGYDSVTNTIVFFSMESPRDISNITVIESYVVDLLHDPDTRLLFLDDLSKLYLFRYNYVYTFELKSKGDIKTFNPEPIETLNESGINYDVSRDGSKLLKFTVSDITIRIYDITNGLISTLANETNSNSLLTPFNSFIAEYDRGANSSRQAFFFNREGDSILMKAGDSSPAPFYFLTLNMSTSYDASTFDGFSNYTLQPFEQINSSRHITSFNSDHGFIIFRHSNNNLYVLEYSDDSYWEEITRVDPFKVALNDSDVNYTTPPESTSELLWRADEGKIYHPVQIVSDNLSDAKEQFIFENDINDCISFMNNDSVMVVYDNYTTEIQAFNLTINGDPNSAAATPFFSVNTIVYPPKKIIILEDESKIYFVEASGSLYQYDLGIAGDITTIPTTPTNQITVPALSYDISYDGSKLLRVDQSNIVTISDITNGDITTETNTITETDISTNIDNASSRWYFIKDASFANKQGNKYFFLSDSQESGSIVAEVTMPTNYDVSGASVVTNLLEKLRGTNSNSRDASSITYITSTGKLIVSDRNFFQNPSNSHTIFSILNFEWSELEVKPTSVIRTTVKHDTRLRYHDGRVIWGKYLILDTSQTDTFLNSDNQPFAHGENLDRVIDIKGNFEESGVLIKFPITISTGATSGDISSYDAVIDSSNILSRVSNTGTTTKTWVSTKGLEIYITWVE